MQPDFLLIGHFTRDLLDDGSTIPGGTALYAALTAYRLGRRVAVVSADAPLPADWPQAIEQAVVAGTAPIFENRYTPQGRVQLLHAAAEPIRHADIPPPWLAASVIHLGPILAEIDAALIAALPARTIGLTPQGLMREWGALPGVINYRPWLPPPDLLARLGALILSIEDIKGDEALAQRYARDCRLVALTRGAQGSTLFIDGTPHQIAAAPATERDPTGAGDVFAAALLVRLDETGDPLEAARFAARVAARSVEGRGASAIPTRAMLDPNADHAAG
ncbi:MAG TPA: PfkB family carbohydrate kinase [Roseiflexaceae bacterium]|nr:PfkB family carbohydrate kinase [Roseiflexaceae bacterium]HMP39826.1 PfkB family carbohydrate kinase [Roseiflexaceae bacterium]